MTAHEPQQRPKPAATRKPTPTPPMSELLASCAAAAAVSTPPTDGTPQTEELTVPTQRPEKDAA